MSAQTPPPPLGGLPPGSVIITPEQQYTLLVRVSAGVERLEQQLQTLVTENQDHELRLRAVEAQALPDRVSRLEQTSTRPPAWPAIVTAVVAASALLISVVAYIAV